MLAHALSPRWLLIAGALSVCGCGAADEAAQSEDVTASTALVAKADGITMWLDPIAHPTTRFDQPAWRFEARASKDLASVFAFSSDDEFGEAVQSSPRKLDVFVDANQLAHLLAGYRILIDIKTTAGSVKQYFASIRVAPKLERMHGSSKIVLRKTFSPFLYGHELRFRNLVGLSSGYSGASAVTDAGGAVDLVGPSGSSTAMDWLSPVLVEVSKDPNLEIDVSATNGSGQVTRSGGVDIGVTSFQLTTQPALEQWPDPQCAATTLACLNALPQGAFDRSSCGAAIDVLPCLWKLPPSVDVTSFSVDLTNYMTTWYGDHGADIAASGGNSLGKAQALCASTKVTLVDDAAQDPHAHDLAKFIVFRHPDVVLPSSGKAWFGAYDRASSTLESIYPSN